MIKWLESRNLEIKFVYLIVVIFGMNHGYEMWDDHFELILGVMDVFLNWPWMRFLWSFMFQVKFWV